ncbi:methyltransferase [Wohlfahrtiimonas chitiniclastica]|uniref:class I SAM-dependent methyltransferase n=1 Tax=Wohlfahrtiimonas chitiniclastica TaxID=400946 RepID=UPI001BCDD1EA|nr:methyltransferase [Wohlfahrtiimonas chitiniclastica]MBS7833705.1 methyltransferase [Wohlfahrtiimonas chitiniclastica]
MSARFKKHLNYINSFIHSPRSVGTLMPSSPALCEAMVHQVNWHTSSLLVAELGAGDGVLTHHILRAMGQDAALYAYEINSIFFESLDEIHDPRLKICKVSAETLDQPFDIIFSCLPFLSLPLRISLRILKLTAQILEETQGTFILFQYTNRMEKLLSRYFDWEKQFVVKNFPPAFVYVCRPKRR